MRDPYDNRTLWQRIKWNLFGETKIFVWWAVGVILAQALLLFGVAFVLVHFLHKYW